MNKKIIEQFQNLINYTKQSKETKDRFRLIQFKNALSIIENFPKKIKTSNDLKNIPGIGKGILERVDEILKNGKLAEVKEIVKKSPVVEELMSVINIGEKIAEKLVEEHNIKSVKDLAKKFNNNEIKLNDKIALGLKYYQKVEEHIPREEVTLIAKLVKKIAKRIDDDLIVTVCGSYRRGKSFSNDIDILLVHPTEEKNYIKKLVSIMSKPININDNLPFLIDNLTDKGETKYMGFCQYKGGKVRRIDIRFIPFESYYSALLYFTGSGTLNKKMRSMAKKKGYILNEYGIYKGKKMIPIASEKDIFDLIGMDYLEPSERN